MNHPMLGLIDKYLAQLPAERDLIPAQEVRDLLLDIRLTFMVRGDAPASLEERLVEDVRPPRPAQTPFDFRRPAPKPFNWEDIPPGYDGGPVR